MDLMIPTRQKNTLTEYMILSGADNRPPMLDKDMYDSWKSRMELYMQNREHGRMILESADCDMKAINIILQGLKTDIYSLVNHHRVAKDLWEKVQLLMQVNTKFLNSLPPEWSKFVTDVKLVKDLHTTNFDQLYAYLEQHELHANEVRLMRERNQDPLALVANHQMTPPHFNTYQSSYNNPQFQQQFSPSQSHQYGSTHPTQHYSTTYPSTPHAITYPSAPYPHAYSSTVHQEACPQPQFVPQIEYTISTVNQQTHLVEFPQIDSGLAVPVFKQGDNLIDAINKMMSFMSTIGRQNSYAAGTSRTRANTSETGGTYSSQQRIVKCFNCQGEGNMARQCPKPKRKRDATWFREKVLLVEAQGNGKVLIEEELEFLADPGITEAVQDTNSSAQHDALILFVFEQLSNQVTNYNKVNNDNIIVNETLSAELERYKEWVKLLEERQNVDLGTQEKLIIDDIIQEKNAQFADFGKEINNLKQTLSEQSKKKELLTKIFNFSKRIKEKEAKNIDTEIALEKKVKELKNIVCKMGQSAQTVHMLTKPQVFYDNNLKQALVFQNHFYLKKAQQIRPICMNEKKVNTKPIDYAELNRLSEDFGKRFVPQRELSDEQALHPIIDQSASSPVKIEAPRELPKVSLVNTSLKKLKYHLSQFDNVVKKRITPNALTEGEWGFEHTKAVFQNEIIPFLKTLKDIFNVFDKDLLNEVTEVQTVFNQMEAAVQQYHVDKQCFEIQKKQFLFENDRLLDQIISQDIMNIVVNSSVDPNTSVNVNSSVAMIESVNYVEICNKCLELEAELIKQHNMVEKDEYNRLSKRFSELEQHCISLEIAIQLNKEIFQKNNTSVNQTEPLFDQLFELNNLKAELQAKDMTIKKLKAHIKRVNETSTSESMKKDLDETETINIELEHRSVEISDLNAQLQEKVFVITTLKNDLRKLKGKDKVDNAAQMLNATTMAPGMYKLDLIILAPQVKNNKESHKYYLKHTMEQAAILRENSDSKNVCNEHVKHLVKGAQALCSVCNECLFDTNHAMCLIDHVNSMNKPIGRTLTLVGNACPLTRITTTNQVPLRVPIPLEVVTPEHVVTRVYTRRPKVPKSVPNSKPKVAKSMTANRMELGTSQGSDNSVAPSSSSLIDYRLSKLFCGIWTLAAPST
ncbi:integrase, catalytic region, zinc finger, CCHC-type containing protein [Tanacetum coccineum]